LQVGLNLGICAASPAGSHNSVLALSEASGLSVGRGNETVWVLLSVCPGNQPNCTTRRRLLTAIIPLEQLIRVLWSEVCDSGASEAAGHTLHPSPGCPSGHPSFWQGEAPGKHKLAAAPEGEWIPQTSGRCSSPCFAAGGG